MLNITTHVSESPAACLIEVDVCCSQLHDDVCFVIGCGVVHQRETLLIEAMQV